MLLNIQGNQSAAIEAMKRAREIWLPVGSSPPTNLIQLSKAELRYAAALEAAGRYAEAQSVSEVSLARLPADDFSESRFRVLDGLVRTLVAQDRCDLATA